jgi:hypothetical protein
LNCSVSVAVHNTIVDHAHGLHVGVDDVEPTKPNPRAFRSLLNASDSGVVAGTSPVLWRLLVIRPAVDRQT